MSTPERYISSDGIEALIGRMVSQCITDYLGTDEKQKRTAAAFLLRTGFLLPDGSIDWHGFSPRQPKVKRTPAVGQRARPAIGEDV
jgi:hypothetical protein